MQLTRACISILDQLEHVVEHLSDADFTRPCPSLGNVTIGQHLRHTIEFFVCLESGFKSGVVNYDRRAHDTLIESDRTLALGSIERIKVFVMKASNQALQLEVGYERHTEEHVTIDTNYFRELSYNMEHAVHHMALMKIGLREIASHIQLPPDFGIAVSTVRFAESGTP